MSIHRCPDQKTWEFFWARVGDYDADFPRCWPWIGGKGDTGYGLMTVGGRKTIYAHRFVYELLRGPIPEGLQIDHLCRNRGCVNPYHMEVVTQRENILRGQAPSAQQARQTHCKRGHPLSGDNLAMAAGKRQCRICKQMRGRRFAARKKAGLV